MIDVLPIMGAGFIGIATIGFLLIQHFLENKITQYRVGNEELVAKQKEILGWIDKAQADRQQAGLSKQNLIVMKALNVSQAEYDDTHKSYSSKLSSSHINSVNALIAAKKLEGKEPEKMHKEAESFSEDQFTKSYMDMIPKAASATAAYQQEIDSNTGSLLKLEGQKSLFWTVCFSCQSTGIICGLVFIFIGAN